MNNYFLLLFGLISSVNILIAQTPKKRLPQNINVPMYKHIFPSLSGDGNQMIFVTNYTNSEGFEIKYSYKTGAEVWADPEPIPSINRVGMDHIGSFCLSYDGNFVVFSSRRTPTIGNYDIWISEKNGNNWSQPINPGKPLNSPANEGNPSLSPDGKSIYFMRCKSMDNTNKNNCGLYVSHRISATRWSEPEALPDYINQGHETTPRIQADNKTLIFASGRAGGLGRLDLYSTTLESNTWTKPVPLSFINTTENDEYISVPARGDIIYFSAPYREDYNIYKAIIPEEYRSKKVLMLTGTVSYDDGEEPSEDVLIQAFDLMSEDVFTTTKLKQNDDSYTIFLPEGTIYDVSAFPQKGGHTYASQFYDLTHMPISRKEQSLINLTTLKPATSIPLTTIRFNDYTAELNNESNIEIKRIVGFLKKNPGTRIEIGAFIDQIYTDSIQTNDLTEIIADTSFFEIEKEEILVIEDSTESNSIEASLDEFTFEDDSLEIEADSLQLAEDTIEFENEYVVTIDSSNINEFEIEPVLSQQDSLLIEGYEFLEETDEIERYIKIDYTYHNDRTQKQAEALLERLIEAGVPSNLLEAKGYGDTWVEDRASEERNYWIEIKILD